MQKILIVDDEPQMRDLLKIFLVNAGFTTVSAATSKEVKKIVMTEEIDLILLDVMLEQEDGFQVCKEILKNIEVPIIFLSGLNSKEKIVQGLGLGADDYILKPFDGSELVARIRVALRKSSKSTPSRFKRDYLSHGLLKLDDHGRKVYVDGEFIELTPKEFELLYLLMKNPGKVFSREQLLECIWGIDYSGGTRTIDTHIKTLRIKLGKQEPEVSDYIQTAWGIGYRFEV